MLELTSGFMKSAVRELMPSLPFDALVPIMCLISLIALDNLRLLPEAPRVNSSLWVPKFDN
jgi:hypothetical protein